MSFFSLCLHPQFPLYLLPLSFFPKIKSLPSHTNPFWFFPSNLHLESGFSLLHTTMASLGASCALCCSVFMIFFTFSFAGDIVHHDNIAPKRPGCENNFVLVAEIMDTNFDFFFIYFFYMFDVNLMHI